jgi:hypothetical protein
MHEVQWSHVSKESRFYHFWNEFCLHYYVHMKEITTTWLPTLSEKHIPGNTGKKHVLYFQGRGPFLMNCQSRPSFKPVTKVLLSYD